MIKQNKKYNNRGYTGLLLLAISIIAGVLTWLLKDSDVALFNSAGFIAKEESSLIIFSVAVMAVIAIPTLFILYFFAWKYRETNPGNIINNDQKATSYSVLWLWILPTIFVIILAICMWMATHKLEPKKPIVTSQNQAITIQVVALRWKWLFIYPEQQIATVNFLQVPVDTPVKFELTADEAPMSSFWIPHWGGQLYAMTGHKNTLHLIADKEGDFPGSTAEINGRGFAGMRFIARSSSAASFDSWVQEVKSSSDVLNESNYATLLKPSENNLPHHYATYDKDLYAKVLMKYTSSNDAHSSTNHGEAAH